MCLDIRAEARSVDRVASGYAYLCFPRGLIKTGILFRCVHCVNIVFCYNNEVQFIALEGCVRKHSNNDLVTLYNMLHVKVC